MIPSVSLVPTVLLLGYGLAACAAGAARSAPAPCAGTEAVVVRNETGGSIDVYQTDGTTVSILGTVGTGTSTLGLLPRTGGFRTFYGKDAAGNYVISRSSSRSRLSFRVICE